MPRHRYFIPATVALLTLLPLVAKSDEPAWTAAEIEFFEKQVRPVLSEHCYECHSRDSEDREAGLLVDSRSQLLSGGDSGPAIVPRDAQSSLLMEAVRHESFEMPPGNKLPAKHITALERWINMGAPWPDEKQLPGQDTSELFDLAERKARHWVWQPIQDPIRPKVASPSWPANDIDHFILARLKDAGLEPAPGVSRNALVRRLYFDLIGLPPTEEQVHEFLGDTRSDAVEQLIDKLLASPHFGERWGRHWLDLVRYAESRGHEFDNDADNAYQYRDYVIRAFNADVPYDQMVREHIAGDLLPSPRLHSTQSFNESILGTGFWHLGEWSHSPVDILRDEADRFDNMIDVMSKTFLGVTVSCARCHDHKFDAISTTDYYALSGYLQSSDYRQVRFESLEHNRKIADELDALDDRFRDSIAMRLQELGIEFDLGRENSSRVDEKEPTAAIILDYTTVENSAWMQDGFIFGTGPRRAGELGVALRDGKPQLTLAPRNAAANDPFWNGLRSLSEKGDHNQSKLKSLPRGGRTLRTLTFTLTEGDVVCKVLGSGHVVACVDSHRMISGPLHGETIVKINSDQTWVKLNLQRYVGHRLHLEFTPEQDAQLEIELIAQGLSPAMRGVLEQRAKTQEAKVDELTRQIDLALSVPSSQATAVSGLVRSWYKKREQLRAQIRHESRLAMAMLDGSGEDAPVYIRGNSSNPGQAVPRRFLSAIAGKEPAKIEAGSGRLGLARHINDPKNPLTSRVMVNRIWHHLMGRGLVSTPDDFGQLGQPVTHPQLLDHLSSKFLADGRSIKNMIRYITSSRTYQLSGYVDPRSTEVDPTNRLWHHRPPKRLEGEAIRDALLAISDRLDTQMYGEPIPIHLTSFMEGRGRPTNKGPEDGAGRRSIYVSVRRNFLSPFMLAFDVPVPFSTMGRRTASNVPGQALILMNDPFVLARSREWARRAIVSVPSEDTSNSTTARIRWMYLTAFAREPSERETDAAIRFLTSQGNSRDPAQGGSEAWGELAHALVNTKEFIFLR